MCVCACVRVCVGGGGVRTATWCEVLSAKVVDYADCTSAEG